MQDTIIFLDFSQDEYAQVVRGIYSPHHSVLFASSLPELFKLLSEHRNPYVVVGFAPNGSFEEKLNLLLKTPVLVKFSFVMIGRNIQSEERRIGKTIPHSITLDTPTSAADVIGAIDYLKKHPVGGIKPAVVKNAALPSKNIDNTAVLSVPELCFQSLDERGLRDVQMECVSFVRASDTATFKDCKVWPADEKVRKVAEMIFSVIGKTGAGHLYRTASICGRILETMQLPDVGMENARGASLLYAWSFNENPRLLLTNYLLPQKHEERREIARLIEKSAARISSELGLSAVEQIVVTMAKLLGSEYEVSESEQDLISSAIVTTDMVNRACWQNGFWNPRAVNHLMRRFAAAEVPDIHPVILGLTLKILCEAVEGAGAHFLREQAKNLNPALAEVEEQIKNQVFSRMEQATPLSALRPGMKISRPLLSFDGRMILNKDTVLDEDLIWRIWQLAAIRPMRSICVRVE